MPLVIATTVTYTPVFRPRGPLQKWSNMSPQLVQAIVWCQSSCQQSVSVCGKLLLTQKRGEMHVMDDLNDAKCNQHLIHIKPLSMHNMGYSLVTAVVFCAIIPTSHKSICLLQKFPMPLLVERIRNCSIMLRGCPGGNARLCWLNVVVRVSPVSATTLLCLLSSIAWEMVVTSSAQGCAGERSFLLCCLRISCSQLIEWGMWKYAWIH